MFTSLPPINLIRYLIVLRTNSEMVHLPPCISAEMSRVLGTAIADRLPTREAHAWRKALSLWDEFPSTHNGRKPLRAVPEACWPVESVIFVYPGKRTYGLGELLLLELKLLGSSADHGFFLEVILPAIEQMGFASDSPWSGRHTLWGHFDIHTVCVARGSHWESLVNDGRLDLRYRATPHQWLEGMTCDLGAIQDSHTPRNLAWLTPFNLADTNQKTHVPPPKKHEVPPAPTLHDLLAALFRRLGTLLKISDEGAWELMSSHDRSCLDEVAANHAPQAAVHSLRRVPRPWQGYWTGAQAFATIPPSIVPYLEIASILHIGKQTHFGCGSFTLTEPMPSSRY